MSAPRRFDSVARCFNDSLTGHNVEVPTSMGAAVAAPLNSPAEHENLAPTAESVSVRRCPDPLLLDGRYRTGALLGRGGMADVVLGYDVLLKRDVAIKIFRSGSGTPDDEERFDREARVLASLSHPNLVTVFDAGIDTSNAHPSGPYLVMEYVAGPTVADVIADGPVDSAQVAVLGAQVAAALDCVHRHGIVHRDVKPGNILLTSAFGGGEPADAALGSSPGTWNAKLTDFGIARVVDSAPLTIQGLTVGTATYLSPEQARGEPAGPASDIYSLALVLLELATGQRAFAGVAPEVAFARLDRRPEIPRTIGPGLVALLRAMTTDDPQRRPSAHEVCVALQDGSVWEAKSSPPSRVIKVGWTVSAIAAGIAALAIAVGTVSAGQSTGEPLPPSIAPTHAGPSVHGVAGAASAGPTTPQAPASARAQLPSGTAPRSTGPSRAAPAATPPAEPVRPAKQASHGHGKHKPSH
jgi:serine/threonine protein kinase